MAINCGHCRRTHESVVEVRACAETKFGRTLTTGPEQSNATDGARKQPDAGTTEYSPEVKRAIENSKIIAAKLKNTAERKANKDRSLARETEDKGSSKKTRSSRWDPPASSADGKPIDPRYQ
jgi:hypothetical protein